MVSVGFIKEVGDEIAPALMCQGFIPTEWKEALITPTYKPGKDDRGDAKNDRHP